MRRLTILILILACVVYANIGCKQTAEDRYQRYLEEVNDSSESSMEFITPDEDPVAAVEDDAYDPFADDEGIVTIPDIPKERSVNMNSNNYEVEKMMMGRE